ncbi:hypothetical protein COLO4_28911 [Corchorus olitorius]|uniref:Uncharacterized protein n=1 Tax=Corchorus olitorius TaxID=93759 RepID=A0A1R3HHS9_9ROSI|nr:hypothetical protein COLO4_28911 [Corchorus olitorius]
MLGFRKLRLESRFGRKGELIWKILGQSELDRSSSTVAVTGRNLAIEQIKLQGFAVRQFSPDLKAESPTPKPRVVDREAGSKTADHSHRLGGGAFQMGSKSPASSSFRSLRLDGNRYRREGKQPLQALSMVGGSETAAPPSRFKDHVDSLLLRSRQVARSLEADERSCEILSGLHGVGEKGESILVGVGESAENRGKRKAKVTVTANETEDSGEKEKRHDCIFCAGMPDLHGDKEAGKGEEVGDSPALLAAKVKKAVGDLFEVGPGPFIPGELLLTGQQMR